MDFKHTSIKQSALGWVKKSIDENLASIRSELNTYIEEKDASILALVEEKLRAVQGVLSMIEQYGAAMLTEEMRSLCLFIGNKEQQDQQSLEVLLRAVLQLPDYLEHIQAGHKDIPIAILPLLNDIRAAKNEDLFSEKLLFLPDLSMHGDDLEDDAIDDHKNQQTRQLAKKLRPSYQFSILGIIQDKDIEKNLSRIGKIAEVMEERSSSEQVARLWWIVGALIESVSRDNIPLGVSVKMLMGKVDQIFRNMMLKGEKELIRVQPIELIKNLLYYIAQPECDGPKSLAIKTAYRLEQFLPSSKNQSEQNIAGPNQELLKTVSDAVKADIEEVKSSLEVYVNSDTRNTSLLDNIPQELHVISDTLAMIGLGPQRQLIESQIVMISKVVAGEEAPESEKLLAMAAELIQIDQALDLMQKGQFHQGKEVTSSVTSRNFEMENMLSGVVTAALDDIQKIKGAILDFIKDTTKVENIDFCKTLLNETQGALKLLNENRASSILAGLIEYLDNHELEEFLEDNRLDQLSQVVVSTEYYLEAVGEQRLDADSILDFADTQLQLLLAAKERIDSASDQTAQDQENLLIDDGELIEVDEESLVDVDFSHMEEELQDADNPDESLAKSEVDTLANVAEVDIPIMGQQSVGIETAEEDGEESINDVVSDIHTDLHELQDVLSSDSEAVNESAAQDPLTDTGSDIVAEQIETEPVELEEPNAEPELDVEASEFTATAYEIEAEQIETEPAQLEQPVAEPELDVEASPFSATAYEIVADQIETEPAELEQPVAEPELDVEASEFTATAYEIVADQIETEPGELEQPVAEPELDVEASPFSATAYEIEAEQIETEPAELEQPVAEPEPDVEELSLSEKDLQDEPEQIEEFEPVAQQEQSKEQEESVESEPIQVSDDIEESALNVAAESENERSAEPVSNEFQIIPVEDDLAVLKPGCDEEILEIYLEEAEEESENIFQLQQDWKLHPEDDNALKNIRRAFHTIKGSGRLVGAMKIGEFAWEFENLLNKVIDKAIEPSEQIIDAVGLAAEVLPELVEELKNMTPVKGDIPYIRGLVKALSEFNADQVLSVRKNKNENTENLRSDSDLSANVEASEKDFDHTAEIDTEEQGQTESDTDSNTDSDSELPKKNSEDSLSQQEETPPDPFVLTEMVNIPGGEVEQSLPEEEIETVEPDEITDLQIDPELLIIYQQEVESHLNTVNSVLEQPAIDGVLQPTEDLYRAIHTINGASRTADISSIGQLATLLEKPLKIILEQQSGLDEAGLELFRKGSDAIQRMTSELVENRHIPDIPEKLKLDLESLLEQMADHTVELPKQDNLPVNQFIDTLSMMNESEESDYDAELVDIFIEEATELLDMSDHTLQTWSEQDDSVDDNADFGLVMELQRYLHTLKGGAKMADFKNISDLSHELESLFIAVIDAKVEKSDELIDLLHECFDRLSQQVDQAKNHLPTDSSADLILSIQHLRKGDVTDQQDHSETQQSEAPTETESTGQFIEKDALHETSDKGQPKAERREKERDVVKVRSDLLDNLVNSAGEVSIYRARMEQQVSSFGSNLGELGQTITRLKNQLRALEAETDAQIHFSHKIDVEETQSFDPLEMDRYTQIQELSKSLSESVDDLSSLQSILGDQVKDSETLLLQQSRINTDLQDGLIRSRMVRFSGLTSRLRRLVRKTSSELARKAELVIEGEQNEVDIKVLDRMVAPIEHILRNAISHGIENPIERVNKGKPETGKITLHVSRDGSDVVLKISDDGAGVNVRKVHARAIELGLLEEHEEVEDNDVIQFILEPGFSTAEQVTQVAGRGVGMDVVDSGIKQLGGSLQIATSPQGTVFTARLPFTLSINQAILVQAAEESFALPLINIEGITRIESDQMQEFYEQEKSVLDYAGQQYSLYYLSTLLDSTKVFEVVDDALKVPVILLRSGDLRVALHIDVLLGNREIVVKPLGKLLSQVKGITGASILADGMVVLILDINGLIRHGVTTYISEIPAEIKDPKPKPEKQGKKVVMVVDDSITMRRVATKLLTRNNYEVVTAKDGVDALAQLEEADPDVMLLDIEMPRMDGFELALHMKNEVSFRDIPIIMITSRTGSKHRDHAMKIGVNKYMGKPYQEEELIENISALVD